MFNPHPPLKPRQTVPFSLFNSMFIYFVMFFYASTLTSPRKGPTDSRTLLSLSGVSWHQCIDVSSWSYSMSRAHSEVPKTNAKLSTQLLLWPPSWFGCTVLHTYLLTAVPNCDETALGIKQTIMEVLAWNFVKGQSSDHLSFYCLAL